MVGETSCIKSEVSQGELGDCVANSPAAAAGIQAGDVITKVGDTEVATFDALVEAVRQQNGPTTLTVERDENGTTREFTTTVDVTPSQRYVAGEDGGPAVPMDVGSIGVTAAQFGPTQYNPLTAVPGTLVFTKDLAVELGKAIVKIPTKVGALVESITGGERDPETPISVVGASRDRRGDRRTRHLGGVLVLPGAAELRARRGEPDPAAAARRRTHRDRPV